MVLTKSLLAGIAALALEAFALAMYQLWTRTGVTAALPDRSSYYVEFHRHVLPVLGVSLLVFATGFWLQYRRPRQTR